MLILYTFNDKILLKQYSMNGRTSKVNLSIWYGMLPIEG
jgi:hypothetical protein